MFSIIWFDSGYGPTPAAIMPLQMVHGQLCSEWSYVVASLTVPGGQGFHFPHFFPKFWSFFLIFPQTFLIFFLILALRVGDRPPGKALATPLGIGHQFKSFGKSILQVPDTGTPVLDNTRPFLRSSIVSFWITPACSKERIYHIFKQYWYTKNVPVFTNTGAFQYLGPEVYFFQSFFLWSPNQ